MIGHHQGYCGPSSTGFEIVIQANAESRLARQQTAHRPGDQIGLTLSLQLRCGEPAQAAQATPLNLLRMSKVQTSHEVETGVQQYVDKKIYHGSGPDDHAQGPPVA